MPNPPVSKTSLSKSLTNSSHPHSDRTLLSHSEPPRPDVSLSATVSLPTGEQKVIEKTRRFGKKTPGGQKIGFSGRPRSSLAHGDVRRGLLRVKLHKKTPNFHEQLDAPSLTVNSLWDTSEQNHLFRLLKVRPRACTIEQEAIQECVIYLG